MYSYHYENIGTEDVVSGDDDGLVADITEVILDPSGVKSRWWVVSGPQFYVVGLFHPEEEAAHWQDARNQRQSDRPPRINADPITQSKIAIKKSLSNYNY